MILRRRRLGRRRRNGLPLLLLLLLFAVVYLFSSYLAKSSADPSPPREVVRLFYQYEQRGDFGSSWELFHTQMKDRFKKDAYIQQRAQVFMSDFGTESFELEIGDPESMTSWKMSPQTAVLMDVYKIPVSMVYDSAFGHFIIQQDVFVAQENQEWRILWWYQK